MHRVAAGVLGVGAGHKLPLCHTLLPCCCPFSQLCCSLAVLVHHGVMGPSTLRGGEPQVAPLDWAVHADRTGGHLWESRVDPTKSQSWNPCAVAAPQTGHADCVLES